jgi:hypothetical protein
MKPIFTSHTHCISSRPTQILQLISSHPHSEAHPTASHMFGMWPATELLQTQFPMAQHVLAQHTSSSLAVQCHVLAFVRCQVDVTGKPHSKAIQQIQVISVLQRTSGLVRKDSTLRGKPAVLVLAKYPSRHIPYRGNQTTSGLVHKDSTFYGKPVLKRSTCEVPWCQPFNDPMCKFD